MDNFDGFFNIRKNVIFEWAMFNRRNQLQGESAEQYHWSIQAGTANMEQWLLKWCDKLVVGILDEAMSQRLQLDLDLNHDKAKIMIYQHEAICDQKQELKGATGVATLEEVQFLLSPRMDSLGRKGSPACCGRDIKTSQNPPFTASSCANLW